MFVLLKNARFKGCDTVCSQWRSTRFNTGRQASDVGEYGAEGET